MCQTIYIFVVLILSSLKISAIDHLFHVFVGHLCVFFGKTSIYFLWPFLNKFVFFHWVYEFFIYFRCKPLIRYLVYKYLLSFCRLSFHFFDGFLWSFLVWCSPTSFLLFCCLLLLLLLLFWCQNLKIVAKTSVNEIFSSRNFIFSSLTFRSLIHFELFFVCSVNRGLVSYFFICPIYFVFVCPIYSQFIDDRASFPCILLASLL